MSEVVAAVVLDGIIDAAREEGAIIAKSSGVEKDKNDDKDVLVVEKNGTKEDVREKPKDGLDGPKEKQKALVVEKDGTKEDVREKPKDGLDGPNEKQEADEKADGLSKSDEKADGLSKSDEKADGLIKPDEKGDVLIKDDEKVAELDKDDEKEKSILPEETSDDVDQKKGKDGDSAAESGLEEADSPAVTARSVPTSNNSRPHNNGEEIVFIDDDDDEEEDGVENDEPIFLGFKRSHADARNYEGKKMKLAKKATEDATDGDDTETS